MNFPPQIDTWAKKFRYACRAKKLTIEAHNLFIKWRDEGLSVDDWNNFPQVIKDKYPYQTQVDQTLYHQFWVEDASPRIDRCTNAVADTRAKLQEGYEQSNEFIIDVGDIN